MHACTFRSACSEHALVTLVAGSSLYGGRARRDPTTWRLDHARVGSDDLAGYRSPLYRRLSSIGWRPYYVGSQTGGHIADPNHEGHDGANLRR